MPNQTKINWFINAFILLLVVYYKIIITIYFKTVGIFNTIYIESYKKNRHNERKLLLTSSQTRSSIN